MKNKWWKGDSYVGLGGCSIEAQLKNPVVSLLYCSDYKYTALSNSSFGKHVLNVSPLAFHELLETSVILAQSMKMENVCPSYMLLHVHRKNKWHPRHLIESLQSTLVSGFSVMSEPKPRFRENPHL